MKLNEISEGVKPASENTLKFWNAQKILMGKIAADLGPLEKLIERGETWEKGRSQKTKESELVQSAGETDTQSELATRYFKHVKKNGIK